jgi:Xaa-Pro aminopeptidase
MSFAQRRQKLLAELQRPVLLLSGAPPARNYQANAFPFRADSNFLYFFEAPEANSAALFDPDEKSVTLFLPERTVEDALWHGALESFATAKARHQVDAVLPMEALESELKRRQLIGKLDALAVADDRSTRLASRLSGAVLDFAAAEQFGAWPVLSAIAHLRLQKDEREVAAMRRTAKVTHQAHVAAMRRTRVGVSEQQLLASVEGTFLEHGCVPAYQSILSVRGEVLHNHGHQNTLQRGDLVLLDAGAEEASSGYCSDVTRSWPVDGRFGAEAKEVYQLVLSAQQQAIDAVKPGVRFRALHQLSSRVLADGLVQMGLLNGSVDDLVEQGAHALFFPHGLGHQIGLDVHDMESFGDRLHYPQGRTRSTQFGLSFLRMDIDLEAGMTFTIEPGLYFVPAILRSQSFREIFSKTVNFDAAERFLQLNEGRGFGGIRIEDDVLCTTGGADVLTASIPKTVLEVEAAIA